MPRRVSARRALAVGAALLALPWPLWALGYVDGGGVAWAAFCAALIAAVVAGPLLAGSPRFGRVAGGLCFLLLALGFVFALAAGFVMWPAAFVFLAAALPRPETTWPRRRVLTAAGGIVAAAALAFFAVLVVNDARDDPDLELRLRTGRSEATVRERLLDDPHVSSVGSAPFSDELSVSLLEGLAPATREQFVATLRRDPQIRSVQVVDEGLWP
jgi:hypothetical protein